PIRNRPSPKKAIETLIVFRIFTLTCCIVPKVCRTCLPKTRGKSYECYQTGDTLIVIPIVIPMTMMFPITAITLFAPISMMMSVMAATTLMPPKSLTTIPPFSTMGTTGMFILLDLKILGKLFRIQDLFDLKIRVYTTVQHLGPKGFHFRFKIIDLAHIRSRLKKFIGQGIFICLYLCESSLFGFLLFLPDVLQLFRLDLS